MDKVRAGEADYHFIEVMACPGGCIGGGGQPQPVKRGNPRGAHRGPLQRRRTQDAAPVAQEPRRHRPLRHLARQAARRKIAPPSPHPLQPAAQRAVRYETAPTNGRSAGFSRFLYALCFTDAYSFLPFPSFPGEYLRSIIVHAKSGPTSFVTPRCAPSAWAEI